MPSEVYPHPPVRFVAFAASFPLQPRLQREDTKEAVYERLADTFPLLEIINATRVPPPVFGGESQLAGIPQIPQKLRMMNRERTRSVTIGPRIIAVECTDHESFAGLNELLGQVLEALVAVAAPTAMSEVSLRYIDEIRHPSVTGVRDWHGLLHESLIGPVDLLDAETEQTSAITVYRLSDAHEVRIVSGAEDEGFVVDPSGPLYVEPRANGPFFRLDIVSEWTPPGGTMPPFAVEEVLRVTGELHAPIREAFENAITDELREHFRGANGHRTG